MKNNKKRTILVIEDEPSLLEVVTIKLEKSGFAVIPSRSVEGAFSVPLEKDAAGAVTLTSVELALKHLDSLEQVDAIWLDHNLLGKEDGLDFVTKFKANGGKWSDIPIFVVSNTSDPALIRTYAALGISRYFVKAEHRLDSIIKNLQIALDEKKPAKEKSKTK